MYELGEILKLHPGALPAADSGIIGFDNDSVVFVDARKYERFLGIGICGTITNTKIMTVTLLQATSAAGAGAKALGTAGTFTATATVTDGVAVADARAEELDTAGGFYFVGVRLEIDEANKALASCVAFGMAKQSPV